MRHVLHLRFRTTVVITVNGSAAATDKTIVVMVTMSAVLTMQGPCCLD